MGRGEGDFAQLLCIRIDVERAVAHDEQPAVAVLAIGHVHDKRRRDKFGARSGAQNLEGRSKGIGRTVACARNHTVSIVKVDHHDTEVADVEHLLACLVKSHALLGAQLGKLLRIPLELVARCRIDNGHAVKIYSMSSHIAF